MKLRDAIDDIAGFTGWNHADRIRYFAWFQHTHLDKEFFGPSDIAACYDALSMDVPSGGVHAHIRSLFDQKQLLKSGKGWRLEAKVRKFHDAKYGSRDVTVHVDKLLTALPDRLSSPGQQQYLEEALVCFRHQAWRGAIILSWNLAFDHLCEVIVVSKLVEFNDAWFKTYQGAKKGSKRFVRRPDFQDVKESEVIDVARSAHVTDKPHHLCLERSLQIRNDAAHPSGSQFNRLIAEPFIIDIVEKIVLGLK